MSDAQQDRHFLKSISIIRPNARLNIVLCHGFGATMDDLSSLADWLDPQQQYNWHFPQGPVPMPSFAGFAWFPRQPKELDRAMKGEYFSNLETIHDEGLNQAATEIAQWVDSLNIAPQSLVLGGFSQGAMVAVQSALGTKLAPIALLVLSGSLIDRSTSTALIGTASPIPVFQSHGRSDTILALSGAMALRELFEQSGFPLHWLDFPGGHEINGTVLEKLAGFLQKISADRQ